MNPSIDKLTVENTMKSNRKPQSSTTYLIIGVVLLVILLIAITVAIGVGIGVTQVTEDGKMAGLYPINITGEEIKGEYYGDNGGIYFQINVNDTYFVMIITSISGEAIVHIMHPVKINMTVMSVNNTNFMIMENQPGRPKYDDYIVPESAMNKTMSIMMGDEKMNDDIIQQFDNSTVNETRQSVLHSLAMSEEAVLIIEAAQALGDLGVEGTEYQSAMKFYMFALRLANARSNKIGTFDNQEKQDNDNKRNVQCSNGAVCPSTSKCPFRKGSNDCFGMCGKGCNCWRRVCGDCCVHKYCLTHDQCCEDKGYFSVACISVWQRLYTKCSQTHNC